MNLQTPGEKTGGFLFGILIPQARYMGLRPTNTHESPPYLFLTPFNAVFAIPKKPAPVTSDD